MALEWSITVKVVVEQPEGCRRKEVERGKINVYVKVKSRGKTNVYVEVRVKDNLVNQVNTSKKTMHVHVQLDLDSEFLI